MEVGFCVDFVVLFLRLFAVSVFAAVLCREKIQIQKTKLTHCQVNSQSINQMHCGLRPGRAGQVTITDGTALQLVMRFVVKDWAVCKSEQYDLQQRRQ